ncbi:MAG: WYL domain-containing protein [Chitinophagales bacterium]|nr:WYL domain-containing protein [Chitinophagales bacterium]
MPVNKLALLRYRIIDKCLQNRFRKWTLENLINEVSDALYEYEGIKSGVSKRTIQSDIQTMRSDKLGYNAPIIVKDKKFYAYEDKEYSITNANISKQDIEKLTEIIKLLNQFKGFNYFEDLSEMVGKLEDKIIKQRNSHEIYIDFEKNELVKGLTWIDPLLDALKGKQPLEISYQSFKAKQPSRQYIIPYLLKEYRNRWFLLCRNNKRKEIMLLALDRMVEIRNTDYIDYIEPEFDVVSFFDDVIGVTKSLHQPTTKVVLSFDKNNAPYVLTKPIHSSQQVLKQSDEALIISINVVINFELEREILGYGESVKVLSPRALKSRIINKFKMALEQYQYN